MNKKENIDVQQAANIISSIVVIAIEAAMIIAIRATLDHLKQAKEELM